MPRPRPLVAVGVALAVLVGPAVADARPRDRAPTASSTTAPPTTLPQGIDVGGEGDQGGADPDVDLDIEVEPVDPNVANEVLQLSLDEAMARWDEARAALSALRERIARLEADLAIYEILADDLLALQVSVAEATIAALLSSPSGLSAPMWTATRPRSRRPTGPSTPMTWRSGPRSWAPSSKRTGPKSTGCWPSASM